MAADPASPAIGSWIDELAAEAPGFLSSGSWDRERLVEILARQSGQGAGARRLADPRCAAVIVGQQPAVGDGPLYTLVKAAHAVAVAALLQERGQPAEALFWCASEDHDLGEAGHADLVLRDGRIERVAHGLG